MTAEEQKTTIPTLEQTATQSAFDEVELTPEAQGCVQRGMAFFKEKRINEAEAEFVKAIDIHPSLAPLYNVFSLLKIAQRGVDALKESVYLAMTTNPEFMDDFVKEGAELIKVGRLEEAEERFQKALSLNPDNTDAHFRLGFLNVSQKKFRNAIKVFENLIQLDPENINAFFMLGTAYSEVREYYPAIANLQYALRLQPEFIEARLTLADSYHNQGKYVISLQELDTLEKFIPDEDTTYLHRGLIKIELEQFEEAIPYFQKAIAVNPQLLEAYELLIGLYDNRGRVNEAIEMAEKALEIEPENLEIQQVLKRLKPEL